MSGFPNRIRRTTLGPSDLEDTWPVKDPRKAIPASTYKTAWWQLAGMNLTVAIGLLQVQRTGTSIDTVYQGFAFDPDGALPLLGWTRSAAGIYTYSFPQSTYPDEIGNDIELNLIGGMPVPQSLDGSSNAMVGHHELTGARAGTVRLYPVNSSTETDVVDGGTFLFFLF